MVSIQSQICSRKATIPVHTSNDGCLLEGAEYLASRWDAKTETVAKNEEGGSVAWATPPHGATEPHLLLLEWILMIESWFYRFFL